MNEAEITSGPEGGVSFTQSTQTEHCGRWKEAFQGGKWRCCYLKVEKLTGRQEQPSTTHALHLHFNGRENLKNKTVWIIRGKSQSKQNISLFCW